MFIFPDEKGDFCAGKESEDARGGSLKICNEFQNMQNSHFIYQNSLFLGGDLFALLNKKI